MHEQMHENQKCEKANNTNNVVGSGMGPFPHIKWVLHPCS